MCKQIKGTVDLCCISVFGSCRRPHPDSLCAALLRPRAVAASTAAVRTVLSVGRVKGIWDGGWGCGEPVHGCGTEPKVHCFRRSHLLVECGARGEDKGVVVLFHKRLDRGVVLVGAWGGDHAVRALEDAVEVVHGLVLVDHRDWIGSNQCFQLDKQIYTSVQTGRA